MGVLWKTEAGIEETEAGIEVTEEGIEITEVGIEVAEVASEETVKASEGTERTLDIATEAVEVIEGGQMLNLEDVHVGEEEEEDQGKNLGNMQTLLD